MLCFMLMGIFICNCVWRNVWSVVVEWCMRRWCECLGCCMWWIRARWGWAISVKSSVTASDRRNGG